MLFSVNVPLHDDNEYQNTHTFTVLECCLAYLRTTQSEVHVERTLFIVRAHGRTLQSSAMEKRARGTAIISLAERPRATNSAHVVTTGDADIIWTAAFRFPSVRHRKTAQQRGGGQLF